MKKIAVKTLFLASFGLLALPLTATADLQTADLQTVEAKSMPTQSKTVAANDISVRKVQFLSQGTKVVGNLYLPANIKAPQASVVVVGPQSSVKEQVSQVYARQLAAQGFVALTFD
ncbi:MAG: hypothetical protein ICV82_07090, partial [Nitrososphaera sp.]|nr:hypothetical protein [Nitrososphaera sp.]